MPNRYTRPAGFTLSELLTSIAILALLLGLVIANFQRGRLSDELRISAQGFAGNLRLMQNLSTIGQSVAVAGQPEPRVPPGGFGITIDWEGNGGSYALFADLEHVVAGPDCVPSSPVDANSEYDELPGVTCDQFADAGLVLMKPGVVFSSVKVGGSVTIGFGTDNWPNYSGDDDDRIDIAFKPPKPIPYLDGVSGKTIQIELKHTKTSQLRTVTIIGASGQISERIGGIQ